MGRPKGSKNKSSVQSAPSVSSSSVAPAVASNQESQSGRKIGGGGVLFDKLPPLEPVRQTESGSPMADLFPEYEETSVDSPEEGGSSKDGDNPAIQPSGEEEPSEDKQTEEAEEAEEEVKEEDKNLKNPDTKEATPEKEADFDIEDFFQKHKDKVKKVKIDGVERVVPIDELVRSYQLREHHNRVGAEIGDMRKSLAEEQRRLNELRLNLHRSPAEQRELDDKPSEIAELRKKLEDQEALLFPYRIERARKDLAARLKSDGFDDFESYLPRMEDYVRGLDPKEQVYYDSESGAKELYFKLKLIDSRQPKEEKKEVKEVKRVPIVKIDGGSRPSSLGTDDSESLYKEATKAWTEDPKSVEKYQRMIELRSKVYK